MAALYPSTNLVVLSDPEDEVAGTHKTHTCSSAFSGRDTEQEEHSLGPLFRPYSTILITCYQIHWQGLLL